MNVESRKAVTHPRRRLIQKIGCDVDWDVKRRYFERAENDLGLHAGARAIFEENCATAAKISDLPGIVVENRGLGPRWIIFVELRDGLEEFAAAVVIEPAGGKCPLRTREPRQYVGAKGIELARFYIDVLKHQASSARRRPENCQRASGGKKLRRVRFTFSSNKGFSR